MRPAVSSRNSHTSDHADRWGFHSERITFSTETLSWSQIRSTYRFKPATLVPTPETATVTRMETEVATGN